MTDLLLDRKSGLYLKETPTKGRGLFCTTDIAAGETLEVTPAILLSGTATTHTDKTILRDYVFGIGKLSTATLKKAGLKSMKDVSCVVMGIASYCNSDENPNAEVVWEEENASLYYRLQATAAIPKDTEICTSYGDEWFEDR